MANIDPTFIRLFHTQFPSLTEKEAQRALLFYLGFNASQIGVSLFAGAFLGSSEVLREAKGILQETRKVMGAMK